MRVMGKSKYEFKAPKPPEKAFCKQCKWFRRHPFAVVVCDFECTLPKNCSYEDTPIDKVEHCGDCMEINRNNDCPDFARR